MLNAIPGALAPNNYSPVPVPVSASEVILKFYPPNTDPGVEAKDVRIYIDVATNTIQFDQKNVGAGYTEVTNFPLPIS
jgi:hypothetical protein